LLAPQIFLGKHLDSPRLMFRRARELAVESYSGL
jgi:hypothetical protein